MLIMQNYGVMIQPFINLQKVCSLKDDDLKSQKL